MAIAASGLHWLWLGFFRASLKKRFFQVPAERKLVEELIAERREGC
jgi:hypothetical protein